MMSGKRVTLCVATVATGILLFTAVTHAQGPGKDLPSESATIVANQTATVEAIDGVKRTVTLKKEDGKTMTIRCGKDVVNFDQIQVGDKVYATVLDRVVVSIEKPGTPSVSDGLTIARGPKGSKPNVIISETETVTAVIDEIDVKRRTVTIEGVLGNERKFNVSPDVDLTKVRRGDELVVRTTRGLALVVEKPDGARPAAGTIKPGDAEMALEVTTKTATVEAVDAQHRIVTLKDSNGDTRRIHLGKECINFNQIKVGDKVRATLGEEVAVAITKPGLPVSDAANVVVARAPAGSKPAVVIADTDQITAKIDAINAEASTVTLGIAGGKPRTIKVGPEVDLSSLKIGDDVVVRSTQALAIVVEAP